MLAAWLRELAPDSQELTFYDQSYEVVIPLPPGVAAGEIVGAAQR